MSVGSGRLGFRFPPPRSRPRWGSGEGKRQVQAVPGFFPLRPLAEEPPLPPSGVTPPWCSLGGSRRGDGHTQPAAAFRRLPEVLLPGKGSWGWGRPVAASRGRELLCVSSLRQRGCVRVCVYAGGSTRAASPALPFHRCHVKFVQLMLIT